MSDFTAWEQANEEYLRAALRWLRLRLELLARDPGSVTAAPERALVSIERPSVLDRMLGRSPQPAPPAAKPRLLPAVAAAGRGRDLSDAAAALERLAASDPPPALGILARRFGLSTFEAQVLLLAVAMELDPGTPALCASAQGSPGRPYPTFALALNLFDEPSWDALSPERPLRYWRLLDVSTSGAQPFTTGALRADERIVNFAKGLNHLDERVAPLLTPLAAGVASAALPPSEEAIADRLLWLIGQYGPSDQLPPIQLLGADSSSKQLVAARVATKLGLQLYRLSVNLLPGHVGELESLAILCQREAMLLRLGVYVDQRQGEEGADATHLASDRFLLRVGGVRFVDTRDLRPEFGGTSLAVDVAKPTPAEQREAWATLLGDQAGDNPARISGQFDLALGRIHEIGARAMAEAAGDAAALRKQLWDDCLAGTRPRLDQLAQRIDPRATWEDLVLPASELALLRQVVAQVANRSRVYEEWGFARKMNRGLGISALFAGESGTGKTMAAEVIANALQLSLFRIDLSAVVSKYIGETEKNLRRLFDTAEDGGAILFFDECDAIFGKRSEVKDSHDRYANIEINYLLQRMESYRGLAILATNMKSGLDRAFLRRLRFTIEFPFPGPGERKLIWQKAFPAGLPTGTLDFDRLARLNLTGGSIHAIALNAAFLAAEGDGTVSMPRVLEAARVECRKLERPVNEADFRWLQPARPQGQEAGAA